jgi:hypothetical protein
MKLFIKLSFSNVCFPNGIFLQAALGAPLGLSAPASKLPRAQKLLQLR